jgi:micrococcal nuclease
VQSVLYFSFGEKRKMYVYEATVTKVYDGDTLTCTVFLGFKVELKGVKVRLLGVDTAELRDRDEAKRKTAYAARDFVRDQVLNKKVVLESKRLDKYGRSLGTVFLIDEKGNRSKESVNSLLLTHGFAKHYDGGKRG